VPTLNNIYQFIRDAGGSDFTIVDVRVMQRAVSRALLGLAERRDWSFFRVVEDFTSVAPYTTGTVSITHNTTALTGSGTSWTTNVAVGDVVVFESDGHIYSVSAVGGNTSITLASAYINATGANLSGASYAVYRRDYTPTNTFKRLETIYDRRMGYPIGGYSGNEGAGFIGAGAMDDLWLRAGGSGTPVRWAIVWNTTSSISRFRIWPAANAAMPMSLSYIRKPTDPMSAADEDTSLDWKLYDNLLYAESFYRFTETAPGAKYRAIAQAMAAKEYSLAVDMELAMAPVAQMGGAQGAKPAMPPVAWQLTTSWGTFP
jgi:hypothetical protein